MADSEKPGLWDEIDYFFKERPSLAPWFRWSLTWGRHSPFNINSKTRTGDEIRRRQHQIMITRYWYHEQMLKRRRSISEAKPGICDRIQSTHLFARRPAEVLV
jgi:hypothetical protein